MKLRVIFIVMALFCAARISMVAANDTMSFTDNLKDCKEYYGSQTIDLQDIKLTTVRQIQGWQNGKCSYQETVSTKDSKYTVKKSKNLVIRRASPSYIFFKLCIQTLRNKAPQDGL